MRVAVHLFKTSNDMGYDSKNVESFTNGVILPEWGWLVLPSFRDTWCPFLPWQLNHHITVVVLFYFCKCSQCILVNQMVWWWYGIWRWLLVDLPHPTHHHKKKERRGLKETKTSERGKVQQTNGQSVSLKSVGSRWRGSRSKKTVASGCTNPVNPPKIENSSKSHSCWKGGLPWTLCSGSSMWVERYKDRSAGYLPFRALEKERGQNRTVVRLSFWDTMDNYFGKYSVYHTANLFLAERELTEVW